MSLTVRVLLLCLTIYAGLAARAPAAPLQPAVEIEEDVYHYKPADNGAGPMWCHGSTCLVRIGDEVFAGGLETLEDCKPLNNCRWTLYKRGPDGWQLQQADPVGRTREPCPMAGFADGRLLMSVNPTLVTDRNAYAGPARPEILQFAAADARGQFQTILPEWDGKPRFTEHSYRSFAADGPRGELILFQNIGYTHAEWAFRDRQGAWTAGGKLAWPFGAEYDRPQPIRVCYPNVALSDRAVYFCGVSDIIEPYRAWREYKQKLTGRKWDYDFRRLFFTWCEDVAAGEFHDWVEIASRDKTCGWITPGDLYVAPDGDVHVLWTERATDTRLREKFFPNVKQTHALKYALLRKGEVVSRQTLAAGGEGASGEIPGRGRFQVSRDRRLLVFYYTSGRNAEGGAVSENRLMEILAGGRVAQPVAVALEHPMSSFFTATVRAGSPPADVIELLGQRVDSSNTISYARIRLW